MRRGAGALGLTSTKTQVKAILTPYRTGSSMRSGFQHRTRAMARGAFSIALDAGGQSLVLIFLYQRNLRFTVASLAA